MKIAVVGSRSLGISQEEIDWISYNLDMLIDKNKQPTIISGGAKGVDSVAAWYAGVNGLDFCLYKPYHLIDSSATYHPRYFFTRNKQIVDNSDQLIVFWDGKSNGTQDVIRYAKKRHKPCMVIQPDAKLMEALKNAES